MHNKELHNLYSSPNAIITKVICWACSIHGKDQKGTQNFGRKVKRENLCLNNNGGMLGE